MGAKELHDLLLDRQPDGAEHDKATCPHCVLSASAADDEPGGSMAQTYTEEELRAAVDKAVAEAIAPLNTRLSEFDKANSAAEVEAKIAEATKPLQEQVDELQSKLD